MSPDARSGIDRVFDGGADALPSRLGPWPKACADCALRTNDPQDLGSGVRDELVGMIVAGTMEFHCLHRTTRAGRHRICACAAAMGRTPSASDAETTRTGESR